MALLPGDDGPYVFASRVPPAYDGFRLLDYFAQRFAYQDRQAWSERIAAGDVRVDSAVETDRDRLLCKDASGKTLEQIEADTDRDHFLSSDEAKEYGLIDVVQNLS